MDERRNKKSITKNEAFKCKIGYPKKWRNYSNYNFNYDNILDIILECRYRDNLYELSFLNNKPDDEKWEMNAYDINAYFHPLKNEIVFPAGILQYPFFDINSSEAENYGGIGVVIGHEMTHSYDDQGSKFDWEGNLNNWWTEEDLNKFKKKSDYYKNQFENESYNNKSLNGKLTLGENLADHGGIKISYQSLIENFNVNLEDKKKFFIAYANIWKNNITNKEAEQRIITDPHSLGIFRVNTTLSNITEFHEVFDIKQNDKMFRYNPENIW